MCASPCAPVSAHETLLLCLQQLLCRAAMQRLNPGASWGVCLLARKDAAWLGKVHCTGLVAIATLASAASCREQECPVACPACAAWRPAAALCAPSPSARAPSAASTLRRQLAGSTAPCIHIWPAAHERRYGGRLSAMRCRPRGLGTQPRGARPQGPLPCPPPHARPHPARPPPHLLHNLLLLHQEGAHDALLDHAGRQVAAVRAVHGLLALVHAVQGGGAHRGQLRATGSSADGGGWACRPAEPSSCCLADGGAGPAATPAA